jgi:hypothetical protein
VNEIEPVKYPQSPCCNEPLIICYERKDPSDGGCEYKIISASCSKCKQLFELIPAVAGRE